MRKTKIIAEGGMLSALGTVLLFFGAVTDVLDLSCAVLAGFCVLFMGVRHGRIGALAVYCTTSALAFLLLPNKLPALLYVFYGGLYPLLKPEIERIRSVPLQWALKVIAVVVPFGAGLAVTTFLMGIETGFTFGVPLFLLIAVIAVFADFAMSAVAFRFSHIVRGRRR